MFDVTYFPAFVGTSDVISNILSICLLQGYLVLDEFFTEAELQPSRDCIDVIVDDLAQKLYKAGKINGTP